MRYTLNRLISVVALALAPLGAEASLVFSFSFDGTDLVESDTAGPITGEIRGLADNVALQPATEIVVTGVGEHSVPFSLPFDVIAEGWFVAGNAFSVSGGEIVEWNFVAAEAGLVLDIGGTGVFPPEFRSENSFRATRALLDDIRFTNITAVPAPASLALVGIGALGLLASYRGRSSTSPRAAPCGTG